MLTLFLHLAARRGEVFKLTWADVDFPGLRIRLSTKKIRDGSLKHNWLPMTKKVRESLLWWWENRTHKQAKHVFTVIGNHRFENQYEGEPFKYRQHFMKKFCKKAGVTPFGFHSIRHLSAIILYKAGKSLSMIQTILRHEHPATTERYLSSLGFRLDQVREAVEVFSERGPAKVILFEKKEAPKAATLGAN